MNVVLLVKHIDTPSGEEGPRLLVEGEFPKVANARAYLRDHAADGAYSILHVFESGIEVQTATAPLRQVTAGTRSHRLKVEK